MKFRADINGLRAIAVIAVVLFHFNPTWVPGGFAGVDVFFVISGFLMTEIIFRQLENNNFSIIKFYMARANRIIPALFFLCLFLVLFGWIYIISPIYIQLGKHIASSMAFLSNIIYWREAGYFDINSHGQWLLHTWSLSVEWQFYMIYPIVLVLLKQFFSFNKIKSFLIVGTVLGFLLSCYVTHRWPDFAYFSFPTRAWELMMGGLVPIIHHYNKKYLELTGIILIIIAYLFFSSDDLWPGYLTLLPVFGTFLIITANNDSIITNNPIMQKLGLWSYSIYLWHWPIVVFGYYFEVPYWNLIGIPISILLGYISYTYIECLRFPFPTKIDFIHLAQFKPLWLVMLGTFGGGIIFYIKPNTYLYPIPNSIITSMVRGNYPNFDNKGADKRENIMSELTTGSIKFVALGDSHMYSILPVLEKISLSKNINLFYVGYSSCPPLIGIYPINRNDQHIKNCHTLNSKALKFIIDNDIKNVFLAARWTFYTEGNYAGNKIQMLSTSNNSKGDKLSSIESFKAGIKETFKKYYQHGVHVYVMLQVPPQEYNPDIIMYRSFINGKLSNQSILQHSVPSQKNLEFQRETNHIIKEAAKIYNNITIIDPTTVFCHDNYCPIGNDKLSFYFDDDHLSVQGAYKLESLITNHLELNE